MNTKLTGLKSSFIAIMFASSTLLANQAVGINSHTRIYKKEFKIHTLKVLDRILSPLEDTIEYALYKDYLGVKKGSVKINYIINSTTTKDAVSSTSYKQLKKDLKVFNIYVKHKEFAKISLLLSNMNTLEVNSFLKAKYIKRQMHMEKLDNMGYKLLSILMQKKIDFKRLEHTTKATQKDWLILKKSIKNENNKEAFDLLFKGLHYSIKSKNIKIIPIPIK